jgi:hypothetical protein
VAIKIAFFFFHGGYWMLWICVCTYNIVLTSLLFDVITAFIRKLYDN